MSTETMMHNYADRPNDYWSCVRIKTYHVSQKVIGVSSLVIAFAGTIQQILH